MTTKIDTIELPKDLVAHIESEMDCALLGEKMVYGQVQLVLNHENYWTIRYGLEDLLIGYGREAEARGRNYLSYLNDTWLKTNTTIPQEDL